MSNRLTFADAVDPVQSNIPEVLNLCPTDERLYREINKAQRAIIYRGKWWGLYQQIRICVTSDGCITWPAAVASLENVSVNGIPVRQRNQWYEYLMYGPGLVPKRDGCTSCSTQQGWGNWMISPAVQAYDRGTFPLFKDIVPSKILRLYPQIPSDVGKIVLIKGHNSNGVWIRTVIDGVMQDGFQMTLALPFVDSTIELRDLTSVQKPLTDERILAYSHDSTTGDDVQIAEWEANVTIPNYRRTFVWDMSKICNSCPEGVKSIVAMAKLDFQPARRPTDLLITGNLLALQYMCMAQKKRDDNLENESIALERASLRELNRELDHYEGDPNMKAVGLRVFGASPLRNQKIGTLV